MADHVRGRPLARRAATNRRHMEKLAHHWRLLVTRREWRRHDLRKVGADWSGGAVGRDRADLHRTAGLAQRNGAAPDTLRLAGTIGRTCRCWNSGRSGADDFFRSATQSSRARHVDLAVWLASLVNRFALFAHSNEFAVAFSCRRSTNDVWRRITPASRSDPAGTSRL